MDAQDAVDLARQAILTGLLLSAPALATALVVGLVVSLLQAVTQIQEQTISFVPKLVAIVAVIGLCMPWFIDYMMQYADQVISDVPRLLSGG